MLTQYSNTECPYCGAHLTLIEETEKDGRVSISYPSFGSAVFENNKKVIFFVCDICEAFLNLSEEALIEREYLAEGESKAQRFNQMYQTFGKMIMNQGWRQWHKKTNEVIRPTAENAKTLWEFLRWNISDDEELYPALVDLGWFMHEKGYRFIELHFVEPSPGTVDIDFEFCSKISESSESAQ